MKPSIITVVVFALCANTAFVEIRAQSATDNDQIVNQLLGELWSGDVETRWECERVFKAYKASHPAVDARVHWAYVLNRIEYDKYREANAAISDLPRQSAGEWDTRYARIWLKLMVGEIDRALIEMKELKTAIVAAAAIDEATRFQLFTRLGRLYGFAEGPGSSKATPATLQETAAVLTDGLNDVDFGHFEDQRNQVTQKYTGLLNEKSSTMAEQILKQQQDGAAKRQQIATGNQQIDTRQELLKKELVQIRKDVSREVTELRQQVVPFESDLARLDAAIGSVIYSINRLASEVAALEHAALHEPDPHVRYRLLRRADYPRQEMYSQQGYRNSLQSQYDAAANQVDGIYARISAAERHYNGQISVRETEARQLLAQRKRNLRTIDKLDNPKARVGYVNSMTSRTNHLPTYDAFPAEDFRRKVLTR